MLLEVLIDNGMCPLTKDELTAWVKEDIYPTDQRFRDWFKVQPYELRAAALERALTPYELGRVLYHMDQRRGFRSNRKEGDGEQKKFNSGDEDRGIRGYGETQELLREHGTMGRVAVHLSKQRKVEAVRRRFVKRDDYVREFDMIWEKQRELHGNDALGALLTEKLHDEIGACSSRSGSTACQVVSKSPIRRFLPTEPSTVGKSCMVLSHTIFLPNNR